MSMAVGEYISVSSQRDTEAADVEKERQEQQTEVGRARELDELTQIYIERGLDYDLARQVSWKVSCFSFQEWTCLSGVAGIMTTYCTKFTGQFRIRNVSRLFRLSAVRIIGEPYVDVAIVYSHVEFAKIGSSHACVRFQDFLRFQII